MKYLLLLAILAVAGLVFFGRRRTPPPASPPRSGHAGKGTPAVPQNMLACRHCGVHLPEAEARMDAAGHPYCSDAHRLLGPR